MHLRISCGVQLAVLIMASKWWHLHIAVSAVVAVGSSIGQPPAQLLAVTHYDCVTPCLNATVAAGLRALVCL